MPSTAAVFPSPSPALLSLLQEIGELKRVRSAAREGSIATRLFLASWARLAAGDEVFASMRVDLASSLVASRLGDLDAATLAMAGLPPEAIRTVRRRAFDAVGGPLDPGFRDVVSGSLDAPSPAGDASRAPEFARRLAAQPRAGVTCPGRPRLVLEPPESHAEHCHAVACFGALLAPVYGAAPATVWLASLSHHLHNATLPDSGFAGESLLGEHLAPLVGRATEDALSELPAPLARTVREARTILADAETPEGRAFHAADTLDRVWQIAQHLRPGTVTMRHVLDDMALVHEGPVKRFQDRVLADAGLLQ